MNGQTITGSAHLLRQLRRAGRLYDQLDALIPGSKTRHPDELPARSSNPDMAPAQLDCVEHMQALEDFLAAWLGRARMLTDPHARIWFSRDYQVGCPLCDELTLIAWPGREGGGIIACAAGCGEWVGKGGWIRLRGMLEEAAPGRLQEPAVPLDARRRARPPWAAVAAIAQTA